MDITTRSAGNVPALEFRHLRIQDAWYNLRRGIQYSHLEALSLQILRCLQAYEAAAHYDRFARSRFLQIPPHINGVIRHTELEHSFQCRPVHFRNN